MKIIKKFKQFLCLIIKKIGIFKILIFNVNSLFVYDEQDKKWYGTSPLLFIEVTHITTTKKTNAELMSINFLQLDDDDLNQLRNIYPGFCYRKLDKWVRRVKPTTLDEWHRKDIK